jgi:hypothetical protein
MMLTGFAGSVPYRYRIPVHQFGVVLENDFAEHPAIVHLAFLGQIVGFDVAALVKVRPQFDDNIESVLVYGGLRVLEQYLGRVCSARFWIPRWYREVAITYQSYDR